MSGDSTTLYVGNLAWSVSDEDLFSHASKAAGLSTAKVARHEDSTRSKGWALLTFTSTKAAADAVATLDGTTLANRPLSVRADRGPSEPRERKPRAPRAPKAEAAQAAGSRSIKIRIGNLPFEADENSLLAIFASYTVATAEIARKDDGSSKGFGTVVLADTALTAEAIEAVTGTEVGGRVIRISTGAARKPRNRKAKAADAEGAATPAAGEDEGKKTRRRSRKSKAADAESAAAAPAAVPRAPKPLVRAFIRNLPEGTDSAALQGLFAGHGAVSALVKSDAESGALKRFGTVTFATADALQDAIATMNGNAGMEVCEDKPQRRRRPATGADAPVQ